MANKKRVRSEKPALISIKDWVVADELIRNIACHQGVIQNLEASAKLKIDKVKADLAARVKISQDAIKNYQQSLEAFATSHRDDFKNQKSRKLNFGVLGWRKSTYIKITKNTLGLIKSFLTRSKQKQYIRIKESVDKDALAKLTDEELADIEARREEKDVFFVEPASTKTADYNK